MKKLLFIYFGIILFSCKKQEEINPCLLNPTISNSTLKRIIRQEMHHNMDSCSINLLSHQNSVTKINEYFFVITNHSPILQYHFIKNAQIINCQGADIAEYFNANDYTEFFKTSKYIKQVWKKERNIPIENKGTCGTLNPMEDLAYFEKLKINLEKYAWRSLIYQYNYQGKTLYYGLYTRIDQEGQKMASLAAMNCDGKNLQDEPNWNQADFLENAMLERQVWYSEK